MTASARVYGLHGLRLRSPVVLAGFPMPGSAWDVDVRWCPTAIVPPHPPRGEVVAARSLEDRYWYIATRTGDQTTLRVPGVCDFVLDGDPKVIECRPDPSADDRFVAVLVTGLVVAFLLGLEGHCTLHASAVESGGTAIAVAGDSGMGKSTLAALLCAVGARLVTDDVLRLGVPDGSPVMCVGGAPQLRLRPAAGWVIDRFATPLAPSTTVDGRLAIEPLSAGGGLVPLAVIVLVCPSQGASKVDLRTVRGAEGLTRLAAITRVAGWKDRSILRRQFELLSEVAQRVPVVEAIIPWGAATASDVGPALLALAERL